MLKICINAYFPASIYVVKKRALLFMLKVRPSWVTLQLETKPSTQRHTHNDELTNLMAALILCSFSKYLIYCLNSHNWNAFKFLLTLINRNIVYLHVTTKTKAHVVSLSGCKSVSRSHRVKVSHRSALTITLLASGSGWSTTPMPAVSQLGPTPIMKVISVLDCKKKI